MLYNGVWEKSNKDQAIESSQGAREDGQSWREAELGPNGRSQRWSGNHAMLVTAEVSKARLFV